MSIKNNKNNKNICLVYIYGNMEDKITLLYSVLYISRYKEYCSVLWNINCISFQLLTNYLIVQEYPLY